MANPNNSDEAKERVAQRLHQMEESGEVDSAEAHAGQVERGHKVCFLAFVPLCALIVRTGRHFQP